MTRNKVEVQLLSLIESAAQRLGRELAVDSRELAGYAADRARHLAGLVGQAGLEEALVSERDSVVLKAGLLAIAAGDAADAEMVGIIGGALGMAARLLA